MLVLISCVCVRDTCEHHGEDSLLHIFLRLLHDVWLDYVWFHYLSWKITPLDLLWLRLVLALSVLRPGLWLVGCVRAPQRRAAPGSSGAERKRSLAASEYRAGLGGLDDVMWSYTGGRLQLRAEWHLKGGCRRGLLSSLCVCVCVVAGAEAQKPGGWPKRWVDVNRCPRWDALPSQCGAGDGAGCLRFTASHVSTALFPHYWQRHLHILGDMLDLETVRRCLRFSGNDFIGVATRNGARVLHPWHHRLFQVHFLPCSCFHLLHFLFQAVGAAQS